MCIYLSFWSILSWERTAKVFFQQENMKIFYNLTYITNYIANYKIILLSWLFFVHFLTNFIIIIVKWSRILLEHIWTIGVVNMGNNISVTNFSTIEIYVDILFRLSTFITNSWFLDIIILIPVLYLSSN